MKFQNLSMHGSEDMACIKKRDEWMDRQAFNEQMDGQTESNMTLQLLRR